MRLMSWGCAASATSLLILTSLPASAGVFSIGGTDYEVQSIFGTWDDAEALVTASPWWGSVQTALDFANVVQDAEGMHGTDAYSCSLTFVPGEANRGPCYSFISANEYGPFFAATEETLQSQLGSFDYFTGAAWVEDAFDALNPFAPVTGAIANARTDGASQYWAYAVAVDQDDPTAVPEPGLMLGLLGLAGVGGSVLKRNQD